jgi:hypothetical protein
MDMDSIDRRKFLKFVGAGSGIAVASALASGGIQNLLGNAGGGGTLISALGLTKSQAPDALSFRAVAGMPAAPWPAYASYVLEGNVNPVNRSGVLTRTVFAGAPGSMSDIALPGLSETIYVTDVRPAHDGLLIQGLVAGRSQVGGESQTVEILVDRTRRIVHAPFSGSTVNLSLQS